MGETKPAYSLVHTVIAVRMGHCGIKLLLAAKGEPMGAIGKRRLLSVNPLTVLEIYSIVNFLRHQESNQTSYFSYTVLTFLL